MLIPFEKLSDMLHGNRRKTKHIDNPMSISAIYSRWIRDNKNDFRYNDHYMTCWKNKIVTSGGAYRRGETQPDEYIEANEIIHKAYNWINERYDSKLDIEENRQTFKTIIKTFRQNAIEDLKSRLADKDSTATVEQIQVNNFMRLGLYVVCKDDEELFRGHYEETKQYIDGMGE